MKPPKEVSYEVPEIQREKFLALRKGRRRPQRRCMHCHSRMAQDGSNYCGVSCAVADEERCTVEGCENRLAANSDVFCEACRDAVKVENLLIIGEREYKYSGAKGAAKPKYL